VDPLNDIEISKNFARHVSLIKGTKIDWGQEVCRMLGDGMHPILHCIQTLNFKRGMARYAIVVRDGLAHAPGALKCSPAGITGRIVLWNGMIIVYLNYSVAPPPLTPQPLVPPPRHTMHTD